MNPLATTQPYTTMHAPTAVDSRRVPYANERLLLPPDPTSNTARAMRHNIMDLLFPDHGNRYPEDN